MSGILKNSLILLFFRLPLILIIISFFLGLSLGNVGLIFLFFGQLLLVPLGVYLIQIVSLLLTFVIKKSHMYVPYSDILLFTHDENYDGTDINVTPSYWVTEVVFFFTYLIINAGLLLDLNKTDSTSTDKVKEKENNRKLRMKVILVFTVLTLVALLAIRWSSNTETSFGLFIGILAGGSLSTAFYFIVKAIMNAEVLDVFGVETQMIKTTDFSKPYICTT